MLPQLEQVARSSETVPVDIALVEDEAQQADIVLQKLNDTITILDQLPTDGVKEEQLSELKRRKMDVSAALDRVRAWRDALAKQLEALRHWHAEKAQCDAGVAEITRSARELCDKYRQPQPFHSAVDDLKAAGEIHKNLINEREKLKTAGDRVRSQLPDASKQIAEIDRLKHDLDDTDTNLQELAQQLTGALTHEEKLLAQQTAVIDQLNALSSKVVAIHATAGDSTGQLQHLRSQIEPITATVQQLENDALRQSPLVYHIDRLNVPAVRAQLDNLVALLNEKQEDASARLALAALASTIAARTADLHDSLKSAQAVEKDSAATIEMLSNALEVLDGHARPQLAAIEDAYKQLPLAPEADAVRTETLADMTNLGNNLNTLQAQLGDRLDQLRDFEEKRVSLVTALTQLEDSAAHIDHVDSVQKSQLVDQVLDKVASLQPSLLQLTNEAIQLQPLSDPQRQTIELQDRLENVNNAMQVS
jgi:uncharacterized protein YoxC